MPEKLRVNRTFWNGSAVHGNVVLVLTGAIGVDNLRETLLSHTTLSRYQHRSISRSHLQGSVDAMQQCFIVANNAKVKFDLLYYFGSNHSG